MAQQSKSAKDKAAEAKAEQEKAEQQAPAQEQSSGQQDGPVGDSGPNHDLPDPPAEDAPRMPEGTVVASESGPLEAPQDAKRQTEPAEGYEGSSTDHTYAAAGGRTVAGEKHEGLVDEDGKKVSAKSLFNDEDGKTFVTVKKRVYEQFYYPNTTEPASRLLFVEGQRVNRAEAERIKATLG